MSIELAHFYNQIVHIVQDKQNDRRISLIALSNLKSIKYCQLKEFADSEIFALDQGYNSIHGTPFWKGQ